MMQDVLLVWMIRWMIIKIFLFFQVFIYDKLFITLETTLFVFTNEYKEIARKSLVAKQQIQKGEVFTLDNLTVKRPGHGISPMRIDDLLGTHSKYSFKENDLIKI